MMITTDLAPATANAPAHNAIDREVSDTTRARIAEGVAANTRKAYGRQWVTFESWCAGRSRVALPATAETLAEYVAHLADSGRGPSTCQQAMAAISTRHQAAGWPKGTPDTKGALLVLRSLRRERAANGQRKRQAPPVTVDALRRMIDATDPESVIGARDRLLVVLGLVTMSRRSELGALNIGDVTETENGLEVLIRASKTDQDAHGATIAVPRGSHPDTDPVRLLRAWLAVLAERGITSGPLLRSVDRHGRIGAEPITTDSISRIVRRLAVRAGLPNAEHFTAHSLRSGGATAAYKAGAPIGAIKTQGRWRSDVVNEYLRAVDRWRDNPMANIGL